MSPRTEVILGTLTAITAVGAFSAVLAPAIVDARIPSIYDARFTGVEVRTVARTLPQGTTAAAVADPGGVGAESGRAE